jgi:hypothetical protein
LRWLVCILLASCLAQSTGLASAVESDACGESCPDEDPGGECPPLCPTCICAAHPHPTVLPVPGTGLPPPGPLPTWSWPDEDGHLPRPEPDEILRVPIAARC